MSRVLLTGASGFLGSHVLESLLERGHEVHAVSRRPGARRERLHWHTADLLEPDAADALASAAQADRLLHLAWYAVPGRFWGAPENERWIEASVRLLRAFGEAGGQRAVMAGTCAEYRWGGAGVLDERSTPLEPATLYGKCKRAAHVQSEALAERLDISLAWGRLFFLYGPGEDPERLVAAVARSLLAGEEVSTTDGLQRRDFMHVSDAADAFASLLDSAVAGPVNIASGRPVSVGEIVTLVGEAAGGLSRVRFGAVPMRAGEPEALVADVTRLREELAWRPQIALEDGIASTVAWWRGQTA